MKLILATVGVLGIFAEASSAQTNFVTVTNYVTVTITNVVVLTNTVAPAAVPATAAAPATAATPPPAAPAHPPKPAVEAAATALAKPEVKYPWHQSVSAGLTLARGNTDTTLLTGEYSANKKTPENEYNGTANFSYGEQDSQQTANNYEGTFQWNHLYTDRFYAYTRAQALRDYIADIDYRFILGPGVGYYLIKTKATAFAVGGGVNYEGQSQGGQADTFATLRLADKFEYKFSDAAHIWQTVEILPQVDRLDNYLVNFELGAEASITKSFSLKAVLDDNYNNRPAADHLKNDVRLVAGIGYKF